MTRLQAFFILLLALLSPLCAAASAPLPAGATAPVLQMPHGDFVTLNFHAVLSEQELAATPDSYAISTKRLAQWFDWMYRNGWHPVSMKRIEQAHDGGAPLPANAVLLTFDDGLENIYTHVYPLLRANHYPALFALETGWIDRVHSASTLPGQGEAISPLQQTDQALAVASPNRREPGKVFYNGQELATSGFVSWAQVREMHASGLAEFATHTDDLHHGIPANPQGNLEPAAITRLYDAKTGTYETDAMYRARIRDDLQRSIVSIQRNAGIRTTIVVWPYGAMNREAEAIAQSLGLVHSFGLQDRQLSSPTRIDSLGRFLVSGDADPATIEARIAEAVVPPAEARRAVQVDLDYVYDPSPAQTEVNLGKLLDRIKAMHVGTVYLQAYADPDGDGTASALYFPNDYLPMRADLFNRVSWQLRTRAGVRVYAWLPLLAFDPPDKALARQLAVKVMRDGKALPSTHDDRRLSPFLPRSVDLVSGIYRDLARNATGINGILISDDAYLAADEDASSCSAEARWPGTGQPLKDCRLSARQKTQALIDFGKVAVAQVRQYRNQSNSFGIARNLYARVVMDPAAEDRFAQALGPFLQNYDEVALMAMPYLDGTRTAPDLWLRQLAGKVGAYPNGLQKTVFELQPRNWNNGQWIPAGTLESWMHELIGVGALNLAYYPDDFLHDRPAFGPTFSGISLETFPYGNHPPNGEPK
ncbi:poly-beta-1,6-N-acetyl-D-glucosamine N-deacetylase PgaB [Rhodanobacter ginsengiterrae]|uniref:poly-beta-1,6-N-acetyl-D-glucosamine N-deacetylase PgaB n=1 Tax=Rhodanobacter ginsengiterrae TaxID=2008451 RepID=UPI003CF91303